MKRQMGWIVWIGVLALWAVGTSRIASAVPPWRKLIPFRKHTEADPNKDYWLTEDEGPWMLLATTFAGPGAEQQAGELVLELRDRFDLPAYLHKRHFDFTGTVLGLGVDRHGNRKRMRPAHPVKFDEFAVLVGNYPSYDSAQAREDLQSVKIAKPDCLDLSKKREKTTQRFIGLRELQRLVHKDPEKLKLGPMRRAFIARNPLLPKEFFVGGGLDPLIVEMNKHVEYSLLSNRGKYTVRVATFRGASYFKGEELRDEKIKKRSSLLGFPIRKEPSKLELAAENAHKLTTALRKRGIEAYEFHKRLESIVTVGSFESDGTPRPDGRVTINPAIENIMNRYGAERKQLPGRQQGLKPRSLDGIPFDVQPWPIKVPRTSIGSAYVARN